MKFSDYLRNTRKKIKLSQLDLAKRLGVSGTYIHQLETERAEPPTKQFCEKLAAVARIDFNEIWQIVGAERLVKALHKTQLTGKEAAQFLGAEISVAKETSDGNASKQIPLIAYVSAGEPFECDTSEFERIDLPAGVQPNEAHLYYAVRVRGDSMLPFLKDGATLIIRKSSRENILNNDTVIFRDNDHNCWVKHVQFSNDLLIFKSFNPAYPPIVKQKTDVIQMERVELVIF